MSSSYSQSERRFWKANTIVERYVKSEQIPCAILGFVSAANSRLVSALGNASVYPVRKPVSRSTYFDLASLTKVMLTTELVLALIERDQLSLRTRIEEFIPEFERMPSWARETTVADCLYHQTGFKPVDAFYLMATAEDRIRACIFASDWTRQNPVYSDVNYIFLGFVLESLLSAPLRELALRGGFKVNPGPENVASTEFCSWRNRFLVGEVHDENAYALGGIGGHAGLFSDVDRVLDFAFNFLMKLDEPNRLQLFSSRIGSRTLGWEMCHRGWSGGDTCSEKTIGHTGFTGTGLWIDPHRRHAWTLLTNRVHPTRQNSAPIRHLRIEVGNEIGAA